MTRLILSFLCFLPASLCLAAPEKDGFLIETIEILGAAPYSLSVLRATLQLEEGKTYTEADLGLAVYRLKTLRFVLEADMRLDRGSKRGNYKLEIRIVETKRYFYVLYSELAYTADNYLEEDDDTVSSVDPDTGTRISGLTVGRRWFPGKNGELNLFFPFSPGISYTHYNLFNRNVVASLALQYPSGFGKNFSSYPEQGRLTRVHTRDSLGVSFSAGYLLTSRQRLNLNYKLNAGTITETTPVFSEDMVHHDTHFRNHKTELAWLYDSKDHPLFPLTGNEYHSGFRLDREFRNAANHDQMVPYDNLEANNYFFFVSGRRYWNYRPDRTFSLELAATWGNSQLSVTSADPDFIPATDYHTSKLSARAQMARNILDVPFLGKPRDFRLEAEIAVEDLRGDLPAGTLPPMDFTRIQARLGLVGRDHYGLIRLSLVYRSHNEELWQ